MLLDSVAQDCRTDCGDGDVAENARGCTSGEEVACQGSAGSGRRSGHVQGLGRHCSAKAPSSGGRVVAHRPLRARRQRYPRFCFELVEFEIWQIFQLIYASTDSDLVQELKCK